MSQPLIEPRAVTRPEVDAYQPSTAAINAYTTQYQSEHLLSATTPPFVPTRVSNLSNTGKASYKEDVEDYKERATGVPECLNDQFIKKDFVSSVSKHFSTWTTSFIVHGLRDPTVTATEMFLQFRQNAQLMHLSKSRSNKAAFAAGGPTLDNEEPDNEKKRGRGRNTQKRQHAYRGGSTLSQKCKACDGFHTLSKCWISSTPDLEDDVRSSKRPRSRTPMIKKSRSATLTIEPTSKEYPLERSFILDSGTTCHVGNDIERFTNTREPGQRDFLWAGNTRDTKSNPTVLRSRNDAAIATLQERYGQWVIEYNNVKQPQGSFATTARTWHPRQRAKAVIWHKRIGHPGPQALKHLVHHSKGVKIVGVPTVKCDACGRSKSKRVIRRAPREIYEGPGERVAIDFHDYKDGSNTKEKTQMLIGCRATSYLWDFYLKNHSAPSIIRALRTFVTFIKTQFSITVAVIKTNNETFRSAEAQR
ncbi:hypothetical protein PTNB29_04664 [Pyrenophora teres f. teres]|nr:hypothetical protein PTNB29_04664 [Pyrenophora teres f. teres]